MYPKPSNIPPLRNVLIGLALVLALLCAQPAHAQTTVTNSGSVWINELHARRAARRDPFRGVEIAAQPGEDISSYVLIVYYSYAPHFHRPHRPHRPHGRGRRGHGHGRGRGSGSGSVFGALRNGRTSVPLARQSYSDTEVSYRFYPLYLPRSITGPVGFALYDGTNVLEFISIGGVVTGRGRTAGLVSTDIGVDEGSATQRGFTIQRVGTGSIASDFKWAAPKQHTFTYVNDGQTVTTPSAPPPKKTEPRINEFHYDNVGTDSGEFVEIVSDASEDLTGYTVVLYNGNGASVQDTLAITTATETVTDGVRYSVFDFATNGLQNDDEGIALVDALGTVVEFLCYEGTMTATDGPAAGQTCTDVGVSESGSTPVGQSVQRVGCGSEAAWIVQGASSGAANACQSFEPCTAAQTTMTRINEIHYDNDGTDVGERIEIVANAGTDLSGWSVELYNGATGAVYNTMTLSETVADAGNGVGFVTLTYATNGLQNDAEGVALVESGGTVVEFLCYEGTVTATDGAASGSTCTDIGVEESSATVEGTSMQLSGCGSAATWRTGISASFGSVNDEQSFEYS